MINNPRTCLQHSILKTPKKLTITFAIVSNVIMYSDINRIRKYVNVIVS